MPKFLSLNYIFLFIFLKGDKRHKKHHKNKTKNITKGLSCVIIWFVVMAKSNQQK